MHDILFPHSKVRETQLQLIQDIKEALEKREHILIHAPTGIGKTAAALAPALAVAKKENKTVFFLTNRHTQHRIVLETVEKIKQRHSARLRVADFIGKKWMCLQSGVADLSAAEFSEYCTSLVERKDCEFYSNLKEKGKVSSSAKSVLKILETDTNDVEKVKEVCKVKKVCPYEITAMHAQSSDIIIADYFHIFNENVRNNLLGKIGKDLTKAIIIIDEAHNLPARIRDLLTISISSFSLEAARKECESLGYKEIAETVKEIGLALEDLSKKLGLDKNEVLIKKGEWGDKIEKIGNKDQLVGDLDFVGEQTLELKQKSFTKTLAEFLNTWGGEDEGFARILQRTYRKERPQYTLTYRCLDPAPLLKKIASQAMIIGISGTLKPAKMYADLLGINAVIKEYKDPFPKKNRLSIVVPKTTTKYSMRNTKMYQEIGQLTSQIIKEIHGNCAVFFPSYQIRDDVYQELTKHCHRTMLLEQQGMTKEEKEELIEKFKGYRKIGAVLLGSNAGSYAEGIDLPGDLLKGVLIVGLPLGKPDLETEQLIKYYDKRFKKGWEYGYTVPAITKTIQAAGRCIRSKKDKGVVVFIDERYAWQNYLKYLPKEWNITISKYPEVRIKRFFSEISGLPADAGNLKQDQ